MKHHKNILSGAKHKLNIWNKLDSEMKEILNDKKLRKSLKKGLKEIKNREYKIVQI